MSRGWVEKLTPLYSKITGWPADRTTADGDSKTWSATTWSRRTRGGLRPGR